MSTYAVGDIQGCLQPLKRLLDQVSFDPSHDTLWSVGDIVNRGPASLETLRFCHKLGNSFRMVLGNHDLHLLAVAKGFRPSKRNDTFNAILNAPDRDELLHWLQQQPLIRYEKNYAMVHAGIPPQWSLEQALIMADEVHTALRSEKKSQLFFTAMYGNEPRCWQEDLKPPTRWRVITNYFTRMRFCSKEGGLEFSCKASPSNAPEGYAPWFEHRERKAENTKIIFGHWAALEGKTCSKTLFPLDTGYIWGGPMRLMNIKTEKYFHQYPE